MSSIFLLLHGVSINSVDRDILPMHGCSSNRSLCFSDVLTFLLSFLSFWRRLTLALLCRGLVNVASRMPFGPVSRIPSCEVKWGVGTWLSNVVSCGTSISTYNIFHVCFRCQVTDNVVYLVLMGEDRILRWAFRAFTYLVDFIFTGRSKRT